MIKYVIKPKRNLRNNTVKYYAQIAPINATDLSEVASTRPGMQLSFFQLDDPVLSQVRDEILNLDINNLTPMEALNKLNDIKTIVGGK